MTAIKLMLRTQIYLTEKEREGLSKIARTGGILKAKYGQSHGLGLADALIAATSIWHKSGLITLNVKHYLMFPDLTPPYRKKGK